MPRERNVMTFLRAPHLRNFRTKCFQFFVRRNRNDFHDCFVTVHSRILPIQDKTVLEGGNVTLLCQAVAVPPSVVTWIYPDGQRIKTRTLAIRNISRSDIGRYSCESNNVCGNDSLTLTIVVQCKFCTITVYLLELPC